LMSVLNAGCCSVSGCATQARDPKTKTPGKD
jgi:hypothetical protein